MGNTNNNNNSNSERNLRSKSLIQERCEEGSLFKTWTQHWGVSIKPVYDMDKLRFEIIDRNKTGKGFNVDVPCRKDNVLDFINFCDEVLWSKPYKKSFHNVLEAEKQAGEKYPKRYKWVTGWDGEKSVGFTNSSKEGYYVLNANNTATKVYVNIPLCDTAIEDICEEFLRTYACRKKSLEDIQDEGINNLQDFYTKNKNQVDADAPATSNSETEEVAATNGSNESAKVTTVTKVHNELEAAIYTINPVKKVNDDLYEFTFKVRKQDGSQGDNEYKAIVDRKNYHGSNELFAKLIKDSKSDSTLVTIKYFRDSDSSNQNVAYITDIAA